MTAVMDHYRLRKYRGPETWAKVREAYLAGEPAPSVAQRFDVGLASIRKKASREGWTRNAMARRHDLKPVRGAPDGPPPAIGPLPEPLNRPEAPTPPVDPEEAREAAIGRAAALLAQGRAAEASAQLKAAETLARLIREAAPPPATEPAPPEAGRPAVTEEVRQHFWEQVDQVVMERAGTLALNLLTQRGPPEADYGAFAWHWRAMILGPEVARADYAQGVHGGWADRYWDAEGRLIPKDPVPPMPDPLMMRQHLRACQAAARGQDDLGDRAWPPRDWLQDGQVPQAGEETGAPAAGPAEGENDRRP